MKKMELLLNQLAGIRASMGAEIVCVATPTRYSSQSVETGTNDLRTMVVVIYLALNDRSLTDPVVKEVVRRS